ncbi:MAG: glycogen synthase GlgA [Proteobacteria bacterium]|nr:glycogen synthase GlgA [Pseudomonadota bacterium]
MKVLFASSEVFPFSKTGGLADVSSALPVALKKLGVDISIITPLYKGISEKYNLIKTENHFEIKISDKTSSGEIYLGNLNSVPVFFLDCKKYFNRDELYTTKTGDYLDNAERFIFFSRAVVEFAVKNSFDIIHLNDWQTAMSAVYAKSLYKFGGKTILTIHNLGYQGLFWHFDMHLTNLGWEYYNPRMLEFWGKINFLKGGIYFSDAITTVSPTYAKEILSEESGFGLQGVLKDVEDRLYGILNGIDYDEWNPEKDKYIAMNYSENNFTEGKKICKTKLIKTGKLNLGSKTPLFGMITRIADQKGFDILIPALDEILKKDIGLIILGSGEKRYEEALMDYVKKYEGKISCFFEFNNPLAHQIEAGADFFLMPSKYEPCGLNQMISMRYGTIPVVRAVGGLEDTVTDINERSGTGIKFQSYDTESLIDAIDRAIDVYCKPLSLYQIRKRAMKKDFSWDNSAKKYLELYKKVLNV